MKSIRLMIPGLGLSLALSALAGCSGEAGASGGAESAASTTAKDDVVSSDGGAGRVGHRGGPHGHPGPEMLLFAALHENLNLTAAQRTTIEGLATDTARRGPTTGDATRRAALAAAIRSGRVDESAFSPPAATDDARKTREATAATQLSKLHDTLTKDQRRTLVNAVSAQLAKGPGGDDGERGPQYDPHGPPDGDGFGHGGPGGPGGPGMMGGFLEGLNLTDAQKASLTAQMQASRPSDADRAAFDAKRKQHEAVLAAKLQAFVGDSFDANAFVTPPADGGGRPAKRPNELAIVVSVLDAAQRETLAEKIEKGPTPRPAPPPSDP